MADMTIRFADPRHKQGSIKLNRFSKQAKPRLRAGIRDSAIILESQVKDNLSGPSHTRFPGNGNPFPGVLTGRLRSSVNFVTTDEGLTAMIGPNVVYARIHEFGGGKIPERPYMKPAMDAKHDQIRRILFKAVTEPLKAK